MATPASILIQQVRSVLGDWGNTTTTLAAAVGDTSTATVSVGSIDDITKGQFVLIDSELMEVLETYEGTPDVLTVARGARGSTAATHSSGAIVRIDPVWGDHEILRAVNQAQDSAFPALYQLADDSATTIASNTYEYSIPSGCDQLARVEVETYVSGVYEVTRQWGWQSNSKIILENAASYVGRKLRFIGYGKFDALAAGGNLDSDFPDDNPNALEYLVVRASANLLRLRQAPIARRDSFIGVTDTFQQSQPYMSAVTAKDLEKEADRLRVQIRMPRLAEYFPDPGRIFFGR